MGNSLSAEAPWRGQRTTQKLSKPKTGNSAGLLNPLGPSNSARPSPVARRLSLPHNLSPAVSPVLPETNPTATTSTTNDKKGSSLGSRLSRGLFRSNTSKEYPNRRRRSNSIEVPVPQQERWSNGTDSFRNGPEEDYCYGQPHIQGSFSMTDNYDPSSYDAQRLLNLVEVPSNEDNSVAIENQMHISEAMRSEFRGRRPSAPETTPTMTRSGSEVSLYTPMRRRSLLTPGVATREVRADPTPSKPRTRYSLPSTPARRESMDSISFPPPLPIPEPVPRALTPCEAEYKQTGAFKLGTLRITNGSPARSPARDSNNDNNSETESEGLGELTITGPKEDHLGTENLPLNSNTKMGSIITPEKSEIQISDDSVGPPSLFIPDMVDPTCSTQSQPPSQILPEQQNIPPLPNDEGLKVPQIQVTSKHSAAEDRLFDDDQNEFSSVEVLDVRIDPNAKSVPPRPRLISERRNSKEISRSDSGIASPSSEYSPAPLSKADSGYSSSVSLRSFSTRRLVPEKEHTSDIEVDVANNVSVKQSVSINESEVRSPTTIASSTVVSAPFDETSPPPVPEKDPRHKAFVSPRALSPSSSQNPRLVYTSKYNQALERALSPNSTRNQAGRIIGARQSASMSPAMSNSSNIITGFRRPGRLQRFLSGSRTSMVVHHAHSNDYTSVPVVPRDMQTKLRTHAGMKPISFRRLALKSAASKETLGTILSVGSAELLQDEDLSPTSSSGPMSIGSTIVKTTFSKKPIPRKPVPVRNRAASVTGGLTKPSNATGRTSGVNENLQTMPFNNTGGGAYISSRPTSTNEKPRYSVPIPRLHKQNTMTAYTNMERGYGLTQGKSYSTTSLGLPSTMPNPKLSKSPPPVSMRTRNMGSLKVAPPVRPQSTPPENMRRSGRPQYSRRGSRDGNLRGRGELTSTSAPNHALGPRSSRESFHGQPPAQAYVHAERSFTGPTMNNTRHMSLGAEPGAPSWDIQVDHGPSLSRRPSSDYSRRSSIASQSSQQTSASAGLGFFRQQHHSQPNLPSLHRRSSYDEHNIIPQDSYIRDNGPYPSISRNGQSLVSDPWSGRSMSMPQQWDQQQDQPLQEPQYSSNSQFHQRRRSVDQYGNPSPYRVLHSYNSPAYRNVPIWR